MDAEGTFEGHGDSGEPSIKTQSAIGSQLSAVSASLEWPLTGQWIFVGLGPCGPSPPPSPLAPFVGPGGGASARMNPPACPSARPSGASEPDPFDRARFV